MTDRRSFARCGVSAVNANGGSEREKSEGWCRASSLTFDMRQRLIAFSFAVCVMAPPLGAHDFWIEPSTYRPSAAETIALQLRVGEHFHGERVAIRPARIERFFARSASGDVEIGPAGTVTAENGATIVAYHGRPARVELAAAKFEDYLREEGLESIIAVRTARGDSMKPGRELFSRCAKTVIGGDDRAVGLRLEIVRRANEFALTFEGKPLANTLVVAMRRGAERTPLRARTDANGIVIFPPLASGVWLVKTVHMIEASPASANADWESIWASETFAIP